MKYAVARKNSVRCPDCKTEFDVTEDLYNAQVECPQCKCQFTIEPPVGKQKRKVTETQAVRPVIEDDGGKAGSDGSEKTTSSGIQIGETDDDRHRPMSTVRLSRNENTMEQQAKNMPAPQDVDTDGMQEVEPVDNKVGCPQCNAQFEVAREFYNAVAECPDCEEQFLIKAPGTSGQKKGPGQKMDQYSSIRVRSASGPDPSTSANYRTTTNRRRQRGVISQDDDSLTTSGIEIAQQDELAPAKYQATATVRLSRNMTMQQRARAKEAMAPPPPPEKVAKLPEVYPRNDEVACPGCKESFEISPEYYGAVAECPDCSAEFLIKPPRKAQRQMTPTPEPKAEAEPATEATVKASAKPAKPAKPAQASQTAKRAAAEVKGKKAAPAKAEAKKEDPIKAAAVAEAQEIQAEKATPAKKPKSRKASSSMLSPGLIIGGLIGVGVLIAALIIIIAIVMN